MSERIIHSQECLAQGLEWLCAQDARWADAARLTEGVPLRLREDGFGALFDAIIGQQVSVASARAIAQRLAAAGLVTEEAIAAQSQDDLRGLGLSRQKARYLHALALARLDYAGLRDLSSDQVIAQLTALPGIGRWTAEIYLMFALGRADVFPANDLALQEAARQLFQLPARPNEKAMRALAQAWTPWRAVAARLLWAYYRVDKGREGIMP